MTLPLYPAGDVVPQMPPMRLIDAIVARQPEGITCAVTVRADGLFFQPGRGIPAHIALEWMAQTCAAFAGCEALDGYGAVRIGFLLGTRDFRASQRWFAEHERFLVQAHLEYRDDEFASFACTLVSAAGGAVLAQAGLNVFHPRDAAAVIASQSAARP